MKFNFPKTIFVDKNRVSDQVRHIVSEMKEVNDAINTTPMNLENVYEELVDVYHSIETLLRMLPKNDADRLISEVTAKNLCRGYYDQKAKSDFLAEAAGESLLKSVGERITEHSNTTIEPGYEPLWDVLKEALNQAQHGKGKERHAQSLPFEEQPICMIPRLQNSDVGLMYQTIKKLQESQRMDVESAINERLGAINYTAASILWLKRQEKEKNENNKN